MPSEADLVRRIVKALQKWGGEDLFTIKVHGGPHQQRGVPDILLCYKGHFVAFEVKRPGRESHLSRYQAATLEKLTTAGGWAHMITTVGQAIQAMNDLKEVMNEHT